MQAPTISQLFDPGVYQPSPYAVPTAVVAASSLLLGFYVLVRERASRESLLFLLLTFLISFWLGAFSWAYSARVERVALWWTKLAYLGIPQLAPAVYHFAAALLRIAKRRKVVILAGWLLSALFSALTLGTDELVSGLYDYPWGYYAAYGWLAGPYLAFFFTFLALAMLEYWRSYAQAEGESERERIKWLAIAFGIAYVAIIDYLPAFGIPLYPIGYGLIFVFLLISGWTIRRYRLIDFTPSFAADKIVDTMVDPLIVCDPDSLIRFANEAALAILGYEEKDLLGSPIDSLIKAGSREEARFRALVAKGALREEEMRFRTRNGEEIDVSVSGSNLEDQDRPAGSVIIARDIRDRKEAARQLEASERRFQLLVDGVVDYAIFMLDHDGHVISWNEGAQRITGYREEEILDSHFSIFFPREKPRREKADRELAIAGREGRYEETGWRVRKNGEKFWASVVITALHDEDGALFGFAKVTRDLTRQRQLEEQLRQSQKMEAIGRLAGGISHDFNNLLTVIKGHTQFALRGSDLSAELSRELETIDKAADRAATLTHQLLAFGRKQVLQPRVLSLNAVVTNVRRILDRVIGEQIDLVASLDPEIAAVKIDPGQIEQVLMNLALNARDAMPDGGRLVIGTANAELDEEGADLLTGLRPGSYVVISVSDTGIGMDRDTAQRIFEPFFTTKTEGEGTGLGLSTVHGIVKQSGGEIYVSTEPGEGTTFRIFLPTVDDEEEDLGREEPSKSAPGGGETILVVEDDEDVLGMIGDALRRLGYTVLEARSLDEAESIGKRQRSRIDLIVSDMVLPGTNGPDLVARLSTLQPQAKVLFISGYARDFVGSSATLSSDIDFLRKPFTPDRLAREVRRVLDKKD